MNYLIFLVLLLFGTACVGMGVYLMDWRWRKNADNPIDGITREGVTYKVTVINSKYWKKNKGKMEL